MLNMKTQTAIQLAGVAQFLRVCLVFRIRCYAVWGKLTKKRVAILQEKKPEWFEVEKNALQAAENNA